MGVAAGDFDRDGWLDILKPISPETPPRFTATPAKPFSTT
ncbi:MAG: VCBS repeat-containing protein [Pyrinomonadaceae bacterium]